MFKYFARFLILRGTWKLQSGCTQLSASRVAAEGTSVQISIMTTTLLCQRIYMDTRGCTSKGGEEGGA